MNSKQPEHLVVEETFGEKLEGWYDRNGNWINVLLIVVLVGFIGWKAYGWMHEKNIAEANADYGFALDQYQQAVQEKDPAQQTDKMQGAITAAQKVVKDHKDQFVGREAQLMIGNAQYNLALAETGKGVDQLEKARDSYNKYISMATGNSEKAAGNIALGNVLENLAFIRSDEKLLGEAITSYNEAVTAGKGTALGAEAQLCVAQTQLALKEKSKTAEVEKIYEDVVKTRGVQLVSDVELKEIKPIELDSGKSLSKEEVEDIKNLSAWSQHKIAEDALAQLK